MYKERIKKVLNEAIKKAGYRKPVYLVLEIPKNERWGDYAINLTGIAKIQKKEPKDDDGPRTSKSCLSPIKASETFRINQHNSSTFGKRQKG